MSETPPGWNWYWGRGPGLETPSVIPLARSVQLILGMPSTTSISIEAVEYRSGATMIVILSTPNPAVPLLDTEDGVVYTACAVPVANVVGAPPLIDAVQVPAVSLSSKSGKSTPTGTRVPAGFRIVTISDSLYWLLSVFYTSAPLLPA